MIHTEMIGSRWTGGWLSFSLLLVFTCLSPLPLLIAPTTSPKVTDPPPVTYSPAVARPPSLPPARPIQRPVPSVIYARDIYESGYQTPHPEICPSLGAHLKVLILITSAPDHAGPRDSIRFTWGHFIRRSNLTVAFFLGSPQNFIRESLTKEDGTYRDLIIGNNIDSYSNLTLKTISMLEWVSKYCSHVPYLLKTDDDMYINIPQLLNFLEQPLVVNASKVIWGRKLRRGKPRRDKWYKYYMPFAQFPGRGLPDYCTGPAYLMTGDCILPLLKAAPEERYLRLEDVFVTGNLAVITGIKRYHEPRFYNREVKSHCRVNRSISIHTAHYYEQFEIWEKLHSKMPICRKPAILLENVGNNSTD